MSDDSHVFRAVAFSQAGLVFVEDDVEHPVQAVFDAPVAAHGRGRRSAVSGGRGDVIAGLEAAAVGEFGARLDADDRGDVGQAQFAGKAPITVEPFDLSDDADGPLFDAAMALVEVDDVSSRVGPAASKALSISARKVGWLALTASR